MRHLRKKVYLLQNSSNPMARMTLHAALHGYRLLDRTVLKRSEHLDRRSEKVHSAESKFLCVIVPKCGSRTILLGLEKAAAQGRFDLAVKERDISEFTQGYEDCYRFAIVRDPWARAYSCYKQKIKNPSPIKQALHFGSREGLHPQMSFGDFVYWLCSRSGADDRADRHWASQHLILGLDLGMRYEFIGKLETMADDLAAVSQRLGFAPETFSERRNSSTEKSDSYLRHYTPDLAELIAQRYAMDIETFGYARPDLPAQAGEA